MTMKRIVVGIAALLFILFGVLPLVFGSWYTVDQTERGVLLRNGALVKVVEPGLGFKTPWIESVQRISVQTHVEVFDKMSTYSKDQQPTEIRVSVNYRVDPARVADVYSRFGTVDNMVSRVVRPKVNELTKVVFGGYTAQSAIQDRGKLNADIATSIQKAVDDGPIIVEGVQVENIDFSKAYEQSIESRMMAEVEVQKLRQNAEREKVQATIVVTQANAKADAVRVAAQAESDAIRLRGEAEADAIKARAAALGSNPALVTLTQAERWDGKLPTTMVPGGAVPMLGLK